MIKSNKPKYLTPILALTLASLMALTAAVDIPVPGSPVSVSLNNLFVLLAGLLLGRRWGFLSVLLYLAMGIIGLPVFSDGGFGWAHMRGPTGGYLIGYALAAYITGWIAESGRSSWLRDLLAATAGASLFFVAGLPWLKRVADLSWERTLEVGFYPFIIGGLMKIVLAVVISRLLRPYFKRPI